MKFKRNTCDSVQLYGSIWPKRTKAQPQTEPRGVSAARDVVRFGHLLVSIFIMYAVSKRPMKIVTKARRGKVFVPLQCLRIFVDRERFTGRIVCGCN